MDAGMFGGGLGGLLGGVFGNPSKPYDKAQEEYDRATEQARGTQQPFLDAGHRAIGDYQKWLEGQKDPSGFINNLMGDYSESPYAQYLQQQSMRAGQNAASASGLTGSTPMMQQLQQNSGNIASADQNNWLQNVLGINTQYGQGQQNLMQGGQGAANSLTNLYADMGKNKAENSYNREAAKQNNKWNTIGSGLSMGLAFL